MAVCIVCILHVLLRHTKFGLALRAISENPLAAVYMGGQFDLGHDLCIRISFSCRRCLPDLRF